MFIQNIQQQVFDKTVSTQSDDLINRLPKELLNQCIWEMDFKCLLTISQVNKKCYKATLNPDLWTRIATVVLNLKFFPPADKTMCKAGFKLQTSCARIIHQVLNLEEKLGQEICQKIEALPIWIRTVQYEDDESLRLSQFPEQTIEDNKNHFFKTICDNNLYLILINQNRWKSRVICFNSAFNSCSIQKKEYFYWDYALGTSTCYFIETSASSATNQYEYIDAWESIKTTLCRILD